MSAVWPSEGSALKGLRRRADGRSRRSFGGRSRAGFGRSRCARRVFRGRVCVRWAGSWGSDRACFVGHAQMSNAAAWRDRCFRQGSCRCRWGRWSRQGRASRPLSGDTTVPWALRSPTDAVPMLRVAFVGWVVQTGTADASSGAVGIAWRSFSRLFQSGAKIARLGGFLGIGRLLPPLLDPIRQKTTLRRRIELKNPPRRSVDKGDWGGVASLRSRSQGQQC